MDVITGNISSRGTKISGLISQSVLRGYSAYQIACQNGFSGSIEQWLYSLRGESIQFKSEGLSIYYKYESDPDWILLVQIDQLLADYSVLDNKPSIGGVELNGNKTLDDLGIQAKGDYVEEVDGYSMVSDDEIERLSHVDNYDDSEIRQAIEAIVLAAVTGVKGVAESEFRKGNVTITPANIGLENVDNTHDADKDVLSAVQDSEGNVFGETYFNGVSESNGDVYLTRPDGTSEEIPVGDHVHDASEITSGTIDIARLPAAALERMVDVANRQARYALTKDQVQNGDTVRQLDTGVMYRVVDDTKLNKSDGYKEYTAGRASAVPWSGVEDKPSTFAPSAHTHTISEVTDIANASVAEAAKLKTPRTIAISGGATAGGVSFDGTGNVNLVVTELDASLLSGTADISITGNAATATQFARERTIEVTGKATAAPKVYDGRQNIALEITDLDAAEKVHKHTTADITDLDLNNINAKTAQSISDFGSDTFDSYADVWFSDDTVAGKPVHNQGLQYNPSRNTLKAGTFKGDLDGTATSASTLTTDAGGANQPVYFSNGVPVATTYELNKTVPADAVFTDTHHVSNIVVSGNFNGKTDTATALSNGNVHINHVENDTVRSSHRITGTGTATVTTDEYGNIVVNSASTPYDSGPGISIADNIVTNTGVRSISESTTDGNITANINGTSRDIPVRGLKSAAFTESTDYAASNHKHSFSDLQNKPTTLQGYGITDAAPLSHEHDASSITSGTIDIARLPAAAIERLVVVTNETARFALTINDVQNGDTVQQEDTGAMYRVIDDTKLNRADGYKEYTAGTASAVPWSGVTGKPESFVPSSHTHTSSDISDISTMTVGKAEKLANARTIALTGAVTGSGSFDGSGDLSIATTVNHTHDYAGASTPGGAANTALKLETSAGSAVNPVYFQNGVPVTTTYELNKTVPSDAVFTDTHHVSTTVVNSADDSTTESSRAITNGNVFINHVQDGTVRSSHRVEGTGNVSVTYDSNGDIIVHGADTVYQTLPNPYAISINGKTYDGSEAVDVGVIDVAHGGTGNSSVDTAPTANSTKMVTSGGVYTALSGKADSNHSHLYAGSSTSGGSATSAAKLDSDAGSSTQPVYFVGGKPTATGYSLAASVPANAVFTDTHYASKTVVAGADDATADTETSLVNTRVFLNHIENGSVVSSHKISGTGSASVTTDTSGNIIINAEDTKYTTLPNPYSLTINGKSYDGSLGVDVGTIDVAHGGTGNTSVDTEPTENSTKMVTSDGIYTALQGKANATHTHLYAGSSTAGGSANSAIKLDSNAGSAIQPIYFSGGKPVATTYSLETSVPSNAVFTDTHYASKSVVASADDAITDTSAALTNTHVFVNHVENGAVTASHRITGTGATTVSTDSSGNILINSTDTKYTELPNPESLIIQGNGTTIDSYKGDAEKTINITYSNVGAAAASHGHSWSDISNTPTTLAGYGITDQVAMKNHVHDASAITSGVFDIARIPVSALERLHIVDNLAAMYQLTKTEVQIGDTVQCDDTKIMYRVVDDDNLDNASGYKEYVAGSASSVPWTGVTGKPSTFTPSEHTHLYAGSSTAGGSANSAEKLNPLTDAGSATNPVFFSGGKPAACTYSLNKTVPADAVFTDTHYSAKNVVSSSSTDTANTDEVLGNGSVYLNLIENGGVRSSHKITGSGATSVTTDAYGNVIISSTDNDTKYTGSNGITLTGTNFTNSGVRAVSTGTSNGTIKVNTNGTETNVAVYGLGSAAYTDSTAYATSDHTHSYAGSSTSGGSATSAVRLDSGATGSETKPIYWTSGGKPAACTYSLNKDVPANAVFTDTHYNAKLIITNSSTSTQNTSESLSGTFYLNVIEDGGVRSSHKITAGSDITLVTDTSGNITISSSDTKYTAATAAPGKVATASAVGSSTNYARQDHTHGIDLATGDNNGQVKIAGTNVSVKGLGSAAYTSSDAYATSGHTHTLSIATDTGTNELSLAASTKYKLTAGGKSFVFTTPANTWRGIQDNLTSDSTSDSLSAAQGKALKALVDGKAASDHTHTLSIASDTGTNELTLVANTKYKLTAGGKTFVFTMPGDTVYTHPTHTAYASGMYKVTVDNLGHVTGATAITKADIVDFGISSSDHYHELTLGSDTGTSAITLAYAGKYKLTAGGKTLIFTMPSSDNTWRGIQNNLTSDSTSDSLSAYQGKVLKGLVDGKASSSHSHTLSIESSSGDSAINLTANTKYLLTAGDKTFIFTTPTDTNTWRGIQNNVTSDSTTESLSAAQGKYLKGLIDGKAAQGHSHTLKIQTSTGTSAISMSANSKYVLTAGGKTFIFTTPPDTTYSSKAAASGGTAVSLVTTGEKYTWNNKSDLTIGTSATQAAAGDHTHTLTIAADSGTNALTLAYGTKYKLTAGGKEFIFTMPASDNTNTHRPINLKGTQILGDNTTALNFAEGTNISLSNSSGTITIATTATKDAPYTSNPANVSTSASTGSSSYFARGDHVHAISLATGDSSGQVKIAGTNVTVKDINTAAYKAVSYFATSGAHTETKSEDTSQKIFLIGAQSQSSSGVKTFSDNEVYVTNGVLTTKSTQIGGTAVTLQYNSTTKSLDFVFA